MQTFLKKNVGSIKRIAELVAACSFLLGIVWWAAKPLVVQEIAKAFVTRHEYTACKDDIQKTLEKVSVQLDKQGNDISYIRGRLREDMTHVEQELNTRTVLRWHK